MKILGLSGLYHDSAAALISNGEILAASHEERYSRIKQDRSMPIRAINRVLENSNTSFNEIDRIVWFEEPYLKFQRSLKIVRDRWPSKAGFSAFNQLSTTPYTNRGYIKSLLKSKLNWTRDVDFVEHHESHMASALLAKRGFGKTLVFTADGIGEFETATAYLFDFANHSIPPIKVWSLEYPNSIGLFYSAITQYLGFEVNEGEYKVMGLAPYGEPKFLQNLKGLSMDRKSTLGKPIFGESIINWGHPKLAYGKKLPKLFNQKSPPNTFEEKADVAASTQKFLEFILISVLEELIEVHRPESIRLAGGVALNCTANSAIARHFRLPVDVQPASGDAGCAVGAALLLAYKLNDIDFSQLPNHYPVYLGSPVGSKIELDSFYASIANNTDLIIDDVSTKEVAQLLADGKVIGVIRGRAEFGPRALGNRSILASPLTAKMKDHLNSAIKFREEFRPFAPVVTQEDYDKFFERLPGDSAKHMLFTVNSKFPNLIPAVTHVDNTSRVQELSAQLNPFLHEVLTEFGGITGVPVLTLTSFNLKGEPIVQNADDALKTFMASGIDALVVESRIIYKTR